MVALNLMCQSQRQDFEYRLSILETVRQAISQMMPGCSNPRTLINPLRLVVTFQYLNGHQEILSLSQLSDGYRTTLARDISQSSIYRYHS
ncbi:MAG: hypothetical protein ABFS56_30020 [Pseudomonadota bacterium]